MDLQGSVLSQELLDTLYDSVINPELGLHFLQSLCQMLHANTASFKVFDSQTRTGVVRMDLGYSDQMRQDIQSMMQHSPWLAKIEGFRPAGSYSGTIEELLPMDVYRGSKFYSEYCRKHDIGWAGAAVVFGEGTVPGLWVTRPSSDPPFSEIDKEVLRQLVPHLRRVFKVYRGVSAIRAQNCAGHDALDLLGAATVTLEQSGKVLAMNQRAEALLKAAGGALQVKGGRLTALVPGEQELLDACIGPACAGGSGRCLDPGACAVVLHATTGAPMYVSVMPYRSGWTLLDNIPAALVFLTTREEQTGCEHRLWKSMFGLTPAECRVAEMMKQAMDVFEISQAIRVKVETVRYYQKCVYRKVGVRGQRELMRLLTRLPSAKL